MSVEEVKKQPVVESSKEERKMQVRPKYGAWTEGKDKLIIEVALPGVKKENVQIKALKDFFMLRGIRDNIMYRLDLELNMDIEPDKIIAKYEEGLLRVELKRHNPLEDAYIVPINGKEHSEACKKSAEDDKQNKKKSWLLPDVYRETDYTNNQVYIEIAMPGAKEDSICLKVLPDWFNLTADRGDFEYRANAGFGAEIVPNKTTAEYNQGLLKIHAQIRSPLDDAKVISVD